MVRLIHSIAIIMSICLGGCSTTQESSGEAESQEIDADDVEQGEENTQIDPYDDNWNDVGSQNANLQQANNTQNTNNEANNTQENTETNLDNNSVPEDDEPVIEDTTLAQQTLPQQTFPQQTPNLGTYNQTTPLNVPPEQTAALPPPPPPPAAQPLPPPVPDAMPVTAELWWVGFDYQPQDSIVRVELLTRGSPEFDFIQEMNQAEQPELVARFYQTALRHKVRRDIDASEFHSPVAYIRMRENRDESSVDVVMTLRDPVKPRMYAENGNVLLTFAIPDRYFGNSLVGEPPIGEAIMLAKLDIAPEFDKGSQLPLAAKSVPDPGGEVFEGVSPDAMVPVEATNSAPNSEFQDTTGVGPEATPANSTETGSGGGVNLFDATNLPDSFDNTAQGAAPDQYSAGGTENYGGNTNGGAYNNVGDSNYEFENQTGAQYQYDENTEPAANQYGGGNSDGYEYQGESGSEGPDAGEENYFEEDDLEDFDDGDGESDEDVDLFDVRNVPKGFVSLSIGAVAQDNYEYDYNDAGSNPGGEDGASGEGANTGNYSTQGEATGNAPSGYDDDYDDGANNTATNAGTEGIGNIGGGNYGDGTYDNATLGNNLGTESTSTNPASGNGGGNNYGGNVNLIGDVAPETPENTTTNTITANPAPLTTDEYESSGPNPFSADAGANYEPPLDSSVDVAAQDSFGSDTEFVDAQPVGRPIKIDFRGAPLSEVIRVLSEESGINFVFPEQLGDKRVYLSLNNIPFSQALEALLQSQGLGKVQIADNLIRIDELVKLEEEQATRAKTQQTEKTLTPTKVLMMRMSYAQAKAVAPIVTELLKESSDRDPRVKVQADERTNSLVVEAIPTDLSKVKVLVERLDLQTPQVKIASRIMEVTKTFGRFVGLSWASPLDFNQGRGLGFGNLVFPNSLTSRFSVDPGVPNASMGSFDFRFGSINNALNLDLRLRMEQTAGTTEILQTNNVTVEDNQEAQVTAGTTDFFIIPGANETNDLTAVNYNLNMFVTPHITSDGSVQMKVRIVSNEAAPTVSANAVTATSNKEVETSLLKQSGETAVIGGAYDSNRQIQKSGIPFLSDIPIIGALFRSTTRGDRQRELLIMVTPTIINAAQSFAGAGALAANSGNFDGYEGGGDGYENTGGYQGNSGGYENGGLDDQYQGEGNYQGDDGAFNYQNGDQGNDQETGNGFQGQQGGNNYQGAAAGYDNQQETGENQTEEDTATDDAGYDDENTSTY